MDRLRATTERLALELQFLGQQGLGEAIQELEGELAVAIARRDRARKDADALKLLYDTLVRAEQHAREAFLAPVQKRVQPYLRLLLPESELVLSEDNLGVTALRRNGQDEPFETLSVGAREQVAVLTRLAFADLLRERGIVAPVVLDDALVNSDPRRFERMLLAIRRAAKNLQIIVLTCDEADWVQAGAPMIRLADCIGVRAN
jgi:DNA repair exonuclease SbcCD ATPase subunit